MLRLTVELKGGAQPAEWNQFWANVRYDLVRALAKESRMILQLSKIEVPIEDQDLINSGGTNGPYGPEHHQTVDIFYGGPMVAKAGRGFDYAVKQHEDTSLNHPLGGKAKYLYDPFMSYGTRDFPTAMADAAVQSIRKHAKG